MRYNLNSVHDMIRLAKYIQSCVYWKGHFVRADDGMEYAWSDFWDHVEVAIEEEGANYVVIDNEGYVAFITESKR